MKSSKGL